MSQWLSGSPPSSFRPARVLHFDASCLQQPRNQCTQQRFARAPHSVNPTSGLRVHGARPRLGFGVLYYTLVQVLLLGFYYSYLCLNESLLQSRVEGLSVNLKP